MPALGAGNALKNDGDKTVRHSSFSSTILDSFTATAGVALTYDKDANKTYVEYNDATVKTKRHSGFSTTVNTSIAVGFTNGGISWDGTNLYLGKFSTGLVTKYSGFSTTVKNTFTMTTHLGSEWDIGNSVFLSTGGATKRYKKHSGFTTTITSSFASESTAPRDYGFFTPKMITTDAGVNKAYSHSAFTSTILSSFAVAVTVNGMGWDARTFVVSTTTVVNTPRLLLMGAG